jgi:hypothetical protein
MYFNNCGNSSINKTFIIEPQSITGGTPVVSACTAIYTNEVISCSGDTMIKLTSGTTIFNTDISVNGTINGDTFYSGSTDLYNVILSAITENDIYLTGATFSGSTLILTKNDGDVIFSTFTGNTSGDCIVDLYVSNIYGCSPITIHQDLVPVLDDTINLGTPIKRFRDINTNSGTSTYWTSTYSISTPILDLGLDSSGNTRQITANNSIIQNDRLLGGIF